VNLNDSEFDRREMAGREGNETITMSRFRRHFALDGSIKKGTEVKN